MARQLALAVHDVADAFQLAHQVADRTAPAGGGEREPSLSSACRLRRALRQAPAGSIAAFAQALLAGGGPEGPADPDRPQARLRRCLGRVFGPDLAR